MRGHLAALAVVYLACILLRGPQYIRLSGAFLPADNPQIAEGHAWSEGRLDLPERYWDTAMVDGKVYSHFPPFFSFVAAGLASLSDGVPRAVLLLLFISPLPLLAYLLFVRATGSPFSGGALTLAAVCGTSLWPVIDRSLATGGPWFVNQLLATFGLLIFLSDYCGCRRIWPAAIGLAIAALSRQLTLFYFPALFLAAATRRGEDPRDTAAGEPSSERNARVRRIAAVAVALAGVTGATLALNAAKFGSPVDSGYMHIYEGRDDAFARDARQYGIFSWHYVPRNLYYANLGFPERCGPRDEWHPSVQATGIWWTTPLLLWLFVDVGRIWRDRDSRRLLLCAAGVYAVLLCYHSTGYAQRGYNRYSLDYVPVLLALVAPRCLDGWRKWVSIPMIVWSIVYFRWQT